MFQPEDRTAGDEEELFFLMDLRTVYNLGYDGILTLSAIVSLSWVNHGLAWDERRPDCRNTTVRYQ